MLEITNGDEKIVHNFGNFDIPELSEAWLKIHTKMPILTISFFEYDEFRLILCSRGALVTGVSEGIAYTLSSLVGDDGVNTCCYDNKCTLVTYQELRYLVSGRYSHAEKIGNNIYISPDYRGRCIIPCKVVHNLLFEVEKYVILYDAAGGWRTKWFEVSENHAEVSHVDASTKLG